MPISQPSFKPIISIGATTPKLTNLNITAAATEFSHAFEDGLRRFILKAREDVPLQIAYDAGESGTKYLTLEPCCVMDEAGLEFTGKSIYIQSTSTTVVEIVEFYTP